MQKRITFTLRKDLPMRVHDYLEKNEFVRVGDLINQSLKMFFDSKEAEVLSPKATKSAEPIELKPKKAPKPKPEESSEAKQLAIKTWEAYREAYFARYKIEPPRNAKINTQIKQLVERIGQDAPELARFYVGHNLGWYLSKQHMIDFCLKDAEGLLAQMKRGVKYSEHSLKEFKRKEEQVSLLEKIRRGEI